MTMQRNIAACRPRDLDLSNPIDVEISQRTTLYDNSIEDPCANLNCDRIILIGPRVQVAMEADPDMLAMCFICAVSYALQENDTMPEVISLGNPQGDLHG